MHRKRLTEIFPVLLPLRKKQRLLFYYASMRLDGNRYATEKKARNLPYSLVAEESTLYNYETGFPMIYQENKVFNLKLVAETLHHIVIRPGETFSFWRLVREADRHIPYREGLVVTNGGLTTVPGGGVCHMSNVLFWLFLHTPLTIVERHTHRVKDFPDPDSNVARGTDATVSEGWLDLKVRNDTEAAYQISLEFDNDTMRGTLYTDREPTCRYEIVNGDTSYYKRGSSIHEEVSVYRRHIAIESGECVKEEKLYSNDCAIGYALPENAVVWEGGE